MKINKYMKVIILTLIVFSLLTNFIGSQVAYAIDPITLNFRCNCILMKLHKLYI